VLYTTHEPCAMCAVVEKSCLHSLILV
jgi:tRNA(Arg) A34 adenosine deaminase TadA